MTERGTFIINGTERVVVSQKGKTVIPFATSGSSGIENSVAQLKKDYPEIQWRDGRLLNGATEQTVREWVEKELRK